MEPAVWGAVAFIEAQGAADAETIRNITAAAIGSAGRQIVVVRSRCSATGLPDGQTVLVSDPAGSG